MLNVIFLLASGLMLFWASYRLASVLWRQPNPISGISVAVSESLRRAALDADLSP